MKLKKMLLASTLFFLAAMPVWANEMMSVDEKVKKMKMDLNLTDEQANQVKPIIEDYKSQMNKLHDEKKARLGKVLSTEQMDRLEDMKKEMKDKHSEKKY